MREDLTHFDKSRNIFDEYDLPNDVEDSVTHVHLGAHQPSCTIEALQECCHGDHAFSNIRSRITKFLRENLSANDIPVGRLVINDQVRTAVDYLVLELNRYLDC